MSLKRFFQYFLLVLVFVAFSSCECERKMVKSYLITFESNNDDKIEPQIITPGNVPFIPNYLEKKGYDFGGWYLDKNFRTPYSISGTARATKSMRLYAKWLDAKEPEVQKMTLGIDNKTYTADFDKETDIVLILSAFPKKISIKKFSKSVGSTSSLTEGKDFTIDQEGPFQMALTSEAGNKTVFYNFVAKKGKVNQIGYQPATQPIDPPIADVAPPTYVDTKRSGLPKLESPKAQTKIQDSYNPNQPIAVHSYTGERFLGQAVVDDRLKKETPIIVVKNIPNNRIYKWTFGSVSGEKSSIGASLALFASDLGNFDFESNEKYMFTIDMGNGTFITREYTYKKNDIYSWQDLQAIRNDLNALYVLRKDIAFPQGDSRYNFKPIGFVNNGFKGKLDGNGHVIKDLYISRKDEDYVGLFASISGIVDNVGIENAYIEGQNFVGVLSGGVSKSAMVVGYTSGHVKGNLYVGGLSGANDGSVTGYSTANVRGQEQVGGLIGANDGKVMGYAIGDVSGKSIVGGLIGANYTNSIITGYARGNVANLESSEPSFGLLIGAGSNYGLGYHSGEQGESNFISAQKNYKRSNLNDGIELKDISKTTAADFTQILSVPGTAWRSIEGKWPALNIGNVKPILKQPISP